MEFSTICRVCMQPISLEYIDLDTPFNETTYFECFNYCTKLEAKSNDKLPKSICLSCANILQMAYDFINAAVEADQFLHECFARLDDNDDTKFVIQEDEIVSKEIDVLPAFIIQKRRLKSTETNNELIEVNDNEIDDVTPNEQLKRVESAESFQDEELLEDAVQSIKNPETQEDVKLYTYILPKAETEPIINKEQSHYTEIAPDTTTHLELSLIEETDAAITNELPIFEIIESIEVEKQEEVQTKFKKNRDILLNEETLPKINEERKQHTITFVIEKDTELGLIEPKEDPINTEFIDFKVEDTYAETESANQQSNSLLLKPKIKCRVCKKKIRKNYADHMNQHTGNRAYKCDKCDDSFFTLKQFKLHKAQKHKKFRDAWFCSKCGEAFESGAKLNAHQDNNHSNDKTSGLCLTCGDFLTDQDALEQHVKDLHWSRKCPVECTHCKKKYQLNTLPMHVQYAHLDVIYASKNKEFTCKYCFVSCEGPAELEEHLTTHKGKHDYTCATCGKDFKGKRVFEEHKASMHPEPNVNPNNRKCNKCDFTTNDLSLLMKHKKKHYNYHHNRIPKYLCAFCPKKFVHIKPLNDHEDYQHGEKKTAHQCDLCDKKFYSNFKLKTHKKSAHENNRPFMCKECPKAFKLKPQLLQHEKNHYNRKIDCPHCDKKFVQPCYLRVHLRTHTNELPFECHLCDKKFAIKVRLTYHLAKHEGIVRKCEHCPKTFDNMAKLRIHRFEHIGYPYVCDHCKENHHKRVSFIRHMKRYHGIIMTEADVEENRLKNMKNFYRNPTVKAEPDLGT